MKHPYTFLLFLSVSLLTLAGCATKTNVDAPSAGAGTINRVYTARELQIRPSSCLYTLTAEQMAAGRYVDVNVPFSNGYWIVSAFVPPAIEVKAGDRVQLSSTRCEKGAIPQVTQIVRQRP